MPNEKQKKEITVTGFVTATEWDDNDNVVAIEISTDEEDYAVESNKLGEELFDFLDEEVEVAGFLREDRDGAKWIAITGYEVLDEDDEDYDDYEDYDEGEEYEYEEDDPNFDEDEE